MGIILINYQLSRKQSNSFRGFQHILYNIERIISYSWSTGNSPIKWIKNVRFGLDHTNQQIYLEKRNPKEHNWPYIYIKIAYKTISLLQIKKHIGHYHKPYTHMDSIRHCGTNATNLPEIRHKKTWPKKVHLRNLQ